MTSAIRVIDQSYSAIILHPLSFGPIIEQVALRIFPIITKGGPRCRSHGSMKC